MAKLILGPLLRRVRGDQAVVWVQTDEPCLVKVNKAQSRTHTFEGVHLAWVTVTDLPTPYEVYLDDEQVWPLPGFPPSVIGTGNETIVFGSCREPRDHGTDALAAYAERAMAGEVPLPGLLALVGDQIYADGLSKETQEWLAGRERSQGSPPDQVVSFDEYAHLYQEAWSQPAVRWLLSTVSTVMIFDDHEIMDDWNSSASWVAEMQTRPWWSERIQAGLKSYWLFQHAGNTLPPAVESMPGKWSYSVDIGRTKLIMMDCRGSRVLDEPVRRMFPQEDWEWLAGEMKADCDHLVLASSLPWLLAPTIHHGEAMMEVLSHRFGGAMERLRRKYDLEHWAAVGHSFDELTELISGSQKRISVLGGDVHHSYVASVKGRPDVRQITCSPLNHSLDGLMRTLLRIGWWRALSGPAWLAARLVGADRPSIRWKPLMRPYFGNAITTLGPDGAILIEGTAPDGTLKAIYSNAARR